MRIFLPILVLMVSANSSNAAVIFQEDFEDDIPGLGNLPGDPIVGTKILSNATYDE